MIHLIFFHNALFIYKMQILSSKTVWYASRCNCGASNIFMMTSYWQVDCDHIYLLKTYRGGFSSDKYTLDCKYVSICIELNTFKRLGIANSFLFIIFQCCYFYVMSQSTFPDQIRPRLSCLNCAAWPSGSGEEDF